MPHRNMDLLRRILMEVEAQPFQPGWYELNTEDEREDDISNHVLLARDAALLEAINLSTFEGIRWRPTRLTFQGYEFLEAARNETFWRKAKGMALDKTGTITVEALKIALIELVRKAMTGVL